MPVYDPRVDAYIAKAAPFAQPILKHLRELVHQACPDAHETIKWSFPNYEYGGAILCSMAAFKQHCSFGFWLGSLLTDPKGLLLTGSDKTAMGHLGQIRSVSDLPEDRVLLAYIREAMALTDRGAKVPRKPKAAPQALVLPEPFREALAGNKEAQAHFEAFSPSQKKEYVTWITEAKTEATRDKRMATALEWIAEGKGRNWKYERC